MNATTEEQIILGLAIHGECPRGALETLQSVHFTGKRALVWSHIEDLNARGVLTQNTLYASLMEDRANVGELNHWLSLPKLDVDLAPVIGRLQDSLTRRTLSLRLATAQEALAKADSDVADVLALLELTVRQSDTVGPAESVWVNAFEAMNDEVLSIGDRRDAFHAGGFTGWETPWSSVNEKIGPLIPDLYILAGGTGMGKTFAASAMIEHVCRGGGLVASFSLEMMARQQMQRHLTSEFVGSTALRKGDLTLRQMQAILDKSEEVAAWARNWYMDHRAGATRRRMETAMGDFQRRHGRPDMMVVDHIHLCDLQGESETVGYGNVSKGIKGLATTYESPVVGLSQLNRQWTQRQNKRPVKSDLRSSGSLEQDAGFILAVYRNTEAFPHQEWPDEEREKGEMHILKARYGEVGRADIRWRVRGGGWVPDVEPVWNPNGGGYVLGA